MNSRNNYRETEIRELAEAISLEYFPATLVIPEIIATDNGITYSYGHYENAYDGLLQHRYGKFHIFLDLDRNPEREGYRMRYTFAHELGHYFIDEHRNVIKTARVKEHPSFNSLDPKNPAEKEADYFASCLLMPAKKLRQFCLRRPLSSVLINDISKHFQVSVSAVIYKYLEISLFPMILVMSKDGKILWHRATEDFKYSYLPKWGQAVPPNSTAGEYFRNGKKYSSEEIVFADDWFLDVYRQKDEQFWEKCYYLSGNKVLSMIWKKEKK